MQDAQVAIGGTLQARITGTGSVEYVGNPRVDQSVTGTRVVRQIGGQ